MKLLSWFACYLLDMSYVTSNITLLHYQLNLKVCTYFPQYIHLQIAIALSAMSRLSKMWKSQRIPIATKIRFYKALVTSIALYGCESWTLSAETEQRIEAFEMKWCRRFLNISYRDRKTNDYVRQKIEELGGKQERLLQVGKHRKLQWYGHITRHDSLAKTILHRIVEGSRKRDKPRKSWLSNIKKWTQMDLHSLLSSAQDRQLWRSPFLYMLRGCLLTCLFVVLPILPIFWEAVYQL